MEKLKSDAGGWIPVLGNKRNLDAKVGYDNLNRGEKGDAKWVTLFIDNLPELTSHAWLKKFFTKFGIVRDVFIPEKRSKATGRRFGFVRYNCAVSADVAISKANGLWMEDRKLFVKIASFDQNDKERNVRLNKGSPKVVTGLEGFRKDAGLIGNSNIPIAESSKRGELVGGNLSYAQMLKGNNQEGGLGSGVKSVSLKLKPTGNDWLFSSVVAKLHKFMEVEELVRELEKENIKEPLVRSMGGRYSLITFKTTEVRDAIIKGNRLQRWFSEIKPWKGEVALAERFVWLNCIGMPLHVWNLDSFRKIGEKWGAFMKVDESTLHCLSFTNGRVLVATEIMSTIDDSIQFDVDGILYKVKVREEPLAFGVEVWNRSGQNTSVDKEVSEGEMGVNMEDMVENSSNNGAEDVNGENKEAVVEIDPRDDEPFDFDVDKAMLENEMEIVEEVAETNVEAEKAVGAEERALQLINVSMQGCNDKAANSSLGVKASAWGSGKVMDSMRLMATNNTTLNINLDPLSCVRLNTCMQTPRASLSNLVDNQDSWVADSVKQNLVITENLRGENDEDDNIPEHHIEVYRTENGPLSAPIKAVINGVKGKKKRKTIDDILGFTRVNSLNNKSRNNKPKCAVYRSAVAALALSASISSDGVTNRNRIILDEAQAIWTCNKIMGLGYDGEEDEVISKFVGMVGEDLDRADKVAGQG